MMATCTTSRENRLKSRRLANHRVSALRVTIAALGLVAASTSAFAQAQSCATTAPPVLVLAKASVGVSALQATQEQRTVGAQMGALHDFTPYSSGANGCPWALQRLRIDAVGSYDQKKNATGALSITRNHRFYAQQAYGLQMAGLYAYASVDVTHNNSLGVKLNQAYAGGVGLTKGIFELDGDMRALRQSLYKTEGASHLLGAGLTAKFDFPLDTLVQGAALVVANTAVPVLNRAEAWQNNFNVDLWLPFKSAFGTWGVTISTEDAYLRSAPIGFKRNYLRTSFNLGYSR